MSYALVIDESRRIDGSSGAFIGRYQIRKELGRGAMGVVYLAEDPAIGRAVAIKTVNFDAISGSAEEKMLLDRLVKEARSAGSLSHPGIVTVYDIGQTETSAYIVMEFVEGVTLLDRMREGNLNAGEVLDWLEQAAQALDFAHSKGVLHRDVKPANIMLDGTGRVRIMDFGIARIAAQQTIKQTSVLGTPAYMSPEQISNKPISVSSDQFSLAVLAYEMLSGKKPFAADSISALLFSIVYQDPTAIEDLNPRLPHALSIAFQKALAKDPAQRFPNCHQMVTALRKAIAVAGPASVAAPVVDDAPTSFSTSGVAPAVNDEIEPTKAMGTTTRDSGAIATNTAMPPAAVATTSAESTGGFSRQSAGVSVAEDKPKSSLHPGMLAAVGVVAALVAGAVLWNSSSSPSTPVATPQTSAEPAVQAPAKAEPVAKPAAPIQRPVPSAPNDAAQATPGAPATPLPKGVAGSLAKLEIYTTPSGATARSGDRTCTTPCFFELKPGDHKLSVTLEGYKPEIRIVTLTESREMHFTLRPPMGTLIMAEPAGATVSVAGKSFTVPFSAQLPAGRHSMEIRTKDQVFTHTVTIEDDTPTSVSFK